jgi:hypothetical protein
MRGDSCHNDILVRRLRQVAEECGATVCVEQLVRLDHDAIGYADLVISKAGHITVCEPERFWRRVGNDLRKAIALRADLLLIATPDAPTAQACRRQLRRCPRPDAKLKVIVCPLGAALEILRATLSAAPGPAVPVAPNQRKET